MIVLSHFTVSPLIAARDAGFDSAVISTDLGISESEVRVTRSGVAMPDGTEISWETVDAISESESGCFFVEGGHAKQVQVFSEELQRFYSLYATKGAPTMMAAGFPMHRIKGIDPMQDTRLKVKIIAPIFGEALDTCTGLGYTAIYMAKSATGVTSIELDPAVHDICRRNPWSAELFTNVRIGLLIGSAFDLIRKMTDQSFSRIIHDPPTVQLAGELYSMEMYCQLFRVLRRGGRMFHYIGDPKSPRVRSTMQGAIRRLQESGFTRVSACPEAFGLLAVR